MKYVKETFLIRAKEIHGEKYDYSQMDYVNQSIKIKIICSLHGDFYKTPKEHLQGRGCPVCGRIRSTAGARKPMSEEAKAKRRATNLAKYGATTFAGSKAARDLYAKGEGPWSSDSRKKAAKTCEDRFGAKTWAESDTGRETLRSLCEGEDVRKLMSERARSDEARQHYVETSMKNYGAPHWTQSDSGRVRLHEMFSTDEERLARSRRMLSPEVRAKIEATSMARYGVPYYWQSEEGRIRLKELLSSEEVVNKTKQTNLERYGHETWQGSVEGRERMASPEMRAKIEATNFARYGAKTWAETEEGRVFMSQKIASDEVQQKIIQSKREHGTINDSQPERDAYALLISVFGEEDVAVQYRSERYPYYCDFYIRSLDLFIELNAYWMHGGHWFNQNDENDLDKLQAWISNDKPAYARAIYIWTQNDPDKRAAALRNNLNYLVFWDNDLHDLKEWIKNGCII